MDFFPPKKQKFYYMLHSTSLKENSFHKWYLQEAKVPLHKHAIRAMKIRVINTLAASRQQILIASSGKKSLQFYQKLPSINAFENQRLIPPSRRIKIVVKFYQIHFACGNSVLTIILKQSQSRWCERNISKTFHVILLLG